MAVDFVETRNTRTAVRTLPAPFVDIAAFNAVVESVIENNPLGCVPYEQAGEMIPGVVRGRQIYTARIAYLDEDGKRVGAATVTAETIAGMTAAANAIMADNTLKAAVGGNPVRDFGRDTYSAQLRCRDPNGETYTLTFTRRNVRLTSYQDEEILATVEDWADAVPALC